MTDKEQIMDKLYGAIAGLFLVYGISTEEGVGEIIIDLLNEAEYQFQFKEQECEELRMKFCSECGERDDDNIPCKMIRDLDYYLQKEREDNDRYRKALKDIQIFTGKIISNDDRPACVYDVECPLNGGVGFDNHCNENCPFILAKQILDIINKAKGG